MADSYRLDNTEAEQIRLRRQAAALRPVTEPLFRAAGIGPGTRLKVRSLRKVLDLDNQGAHAPLVNLATRTTTPLDSGRLLVTRP
jgi:hypothetical protein